MTAGILLWTQAATFVGLGAWKFNAGEWKLGTAQLMLAGITWLIYA